MKHPAAVIEKAQRLEQLLLRTEQGESFEQVGVELGVQVEVHRLSVLQEKYEIGGRTWEALFDGRYGHPQKAHSALREWLYERKRQDETLTAPQLAQEVQEKFGVELSAGHINYLLRQVGLTRPPGRVSCRPQAKAEPEQDEACSQSLDNAGLFFPGGSEAGDEGDRDRG